MSFIQENNPWIGGRIVPPHAVENSSPGILGKIKFYRALEEAMQKQGTSG